MNIFARIFGLSQSPNNTLPLFVRHTKMTEECGEFAEALLHKQGYLPYKTMKEPLEGEAADVMLCVLDTLAGAYPELSPIELTEMMEQQIAAKCAKWERIMQEKRDIQDRLMDAGN